MQTHIHIYPSPITFENRIEREVKAIAELGVNIIIFGSHEKGLKRREALDARIEIRRLNRRFDRFFITRILFMLLFYVRSMLQLIICRPDIVNLHSLSVLPLAPFCRLIGARVIYDAHELETETKQLRGLRKAISKQVEAFFIKFTFAQIFVSASIRTHYQERYHLSNIAVVRNLPLYRKIEAQDRFRDLFPISSDTKIFLYQGALVPGRGVKEIISAFIGQRHKALVIMGFGTLADEAMAAAAQHENIHFCPAVAPKELLTYTASADFGILSTDTSCLNHLYCLPNKLFEYIMAGLPILSTDLVEVGQILKQYDCGEIVADLSPASLNKASQKMIEAGYERAQIFKIAQQLHWEHDKKVLQDFYKTSILQPIM